MVCFVSLSNNFAALAPKLFGGNIGGLAALFVLFSVMFSILCPARNFNEWETKNTGTKLSPVDESGRRVYPLHQSLAIFLCLCGLNVSQPDMSSERQVFKRYQTLSKYISLQGYK